MQSQRHESEDAACGYLCDYDEELLGLVHFEKRAPERFQSPGKHDDRGPKCYLGVAHVKTFEHKHTHHIEHHKGHTHGKIERWHP